MIDGSVNQSDVNIFYVLLDQFSYCLVHFSPELYRKNRTNKQILWKSEDDFVWKGQIQKINTIKLIEMMNL